jgi:hypothetical protein
LKSKVEGITVKIFGKGICTHKKIKKYKNIEKRLNLFNQSLKAMKKRKRQKKKLGNTK